MKNHKPRNIRPTRKVLTCALAIDSDGADTTVAETLVPELIVRESTIQSDGDRPTADSS